MFRKRADGDLGAQCLARHRPGDGSGSCQGCRSDCGSHDYTRLDGCAYAGFPTDARRDADNVTYARTGSHSDEDAATYFDTHSNADRNPNRDTISDGHTDTDAVTHGDAQSDTDRGPNSYACANSNSATNSCAYRHANSYTYAVAHSDSNAAPSP